MTFYIFTRESLALFKRAHDEPDKAVIYGSDQTVLRWPRHSAYSQQQITPPELPLHQTLSESDKRLAIYIPDMHLANREKLQLNGIATLETILKYNILFNESPALSGILLYETLETDLIFLYTGGIHLIMFPKKDTISFLDKMSFSLDKINIEYFRCNDSISIKSIHILEIYHIVNQIHQLPDFEKLTGWTYNVDFVKMVTKYKINSAEIIRRFPEDAEKSFLADPTIYETIFDDLITEADLQDFLIKVTENFIEFKESQIDNYQTLQQAYFNMGMMLSNHPDQKMRDLSIDYLLKAGDMPEAKSLRTRLFLNRVGLNLDISINLDLETLFKLASLIKK